MKKVIFLIIIAASITSAVVVEHAKSTDLNQTTTLSDREIVGIIIAGLSRRNCICVACVVQGSNKPGRRCRCNEADNQCRRETECASVALYNQTQKDALVGEIMKIIDSFQPPIPAHRQPGIINQVIEEEAKLY